MSQNKIIETGRTYSTREKPGAWLVNGVFAQTSFVAKAILPVAVMIQTNNYNKTTINKYLFVCSHCNIILKNLIKLVTVK